MTPQQTTQQRRPNLGRLYLQGLAAYSYFRLRDAVQTVIKLMLTPPRWALRQAERGWQRLKPWLARHKRRLLWSALALILLSGLIGGAVTLYLWRDSLALTVAALQNKGQQLATRLFRRPTPVVIIATGSAGSAAGVAQTVAATPDGVSAK